jgi:uncharacterized protein
MLSANQGVFESEPPRLPNRLPWFAGLFVVAASVLIFGFATVIATDLSILFDATTEFGQPRAYMAGEQESLATARLASFLLAIQIITVLLTPLAAMALVKMGRGTFADWRSVLPLSLRTTNIKALVLAVISLVILAAIYGAIIYVTAPAMLKDDVRPFATLMRTDTWWLLLLAAGVGAPLAEEMLFRGFLFGGLSATRLGPIAAAVISAATWAGLHLNYSAVGIAAIFLIGLYLAWLRWRFDTLIIPIVCHSVYNSLIMLVLLNTSPSALN